MKKISPLYVALGFAAAVVIAGFVDSHPAPANSKNAADAGNVVVIDGSSAPTASGNNAAPLSTSESAALRPDVQAFINQNYGTSAPMVQALDQFGQSVQDLMLLASNDAKARELADHEGRSLDCVYFVGRVLAKADTNMATNAVDRVRALIINTPDRQAKMQAANARLHGYIYTGVPIPQERQTCDFAIADDGGNSAASEAAAKGEPND